MRRPSAVLQVLSPPPLPPQPPGTGKTRTIIEAVRLLKVRLPPARAVAGTHARASAGAFCGAAAAARVHVHERRGG